MMRRLICALLGHQWHVPLDIWRRIYCLRCAREI